MQFHNLVSYLDDYLRIATIADYGPQGLQVEAADGDVQMIAVSTDSALPVIDDAVRAGAQLLIVHHGLFWGNPERLCGSLGRRVRRLFEANLSLYAAHLALDAHPEVGNNAVLARELGLQITDWWAEVMGIKIGVLANAPAGWTRNDLVETVRTVLPGEPLVQLYGPSQVRRVAILSGDGADFLAQAQAIGADTVITGETSHAAYYRAQELALNVVYAGHYATETLGVRALAQHLAERFGLATIWIDQPTGL